MILLQLFYEFFITGLFIFGGGLTAIPFLQQIGEKTDWFTTQQLMDMIAVSEATPGPIGVNMATYVGFTVAGVPGSLIATGALLLPSVIIALVIARLLTLFSEKQLVKSMMYGLRPASLGLIASAGLTVILFSLVSVKMEDFPEYHTFVLDYKGLILAAVLFISINRLKTHPVIFLAGSAVVGMIIY